MYSQVIKPGEKVLLNNDHEHYLTLTNVSINNKKGVNDKNVQRLIGHVQTIDPYCNMDEKDYQSKFVKEKLLLASFVPGDKETIEVNFMFTPLHIVYLENLGKYEMHCCGNIEKVPVLDMSEDLYEEEEDNLYEEEEDGNDIGEGEVNNNIKEVDVNTLLNMSLKKDKRK